MGSELVFEEINFDEEFSDSNPIDLLSPKNTEMLLWEINANTLAEKHEFKKISLLLRNESTLSLTFHQLSSLKIRANKSQLIKKMIKAGFCVITNTGITIITPSINDKTI